MLNRESLAAVAAVLVLSCSCEPSPSARDAQPTGTPPSRQASGAQPSDPPNVPASSPSQSTIADAESADRCAQIRARFNAAHAARTDACSSASDCACFNPVGGPQLACGGVTDAATAKKLADIEKEFHAAACHFTHNCAAWSCAPRCVSGRCSR